MAYTTEETTRAVMAAVEQCRNQILLATERLAKAEQAGVTVRSVAAFRAAQTKKQREYEKAIEVLRKEVIAAQDWTWENFLSARGAFGAFMQHQKHDPHETTVKARETIAGGFATQVDPDGTLRATDPREFELQVAAAKRAYYAYRGRRSGESRRERKRKRLEAQAGQVAA